MVCWKGTECHGGSFPTAKSPRASLALLAEKGRALRLHDAGNFTQPAAGARAVGLVVDAVKVLVAALSVQRVAIGAVAQGGAFVADRFGKYPVRGVGKGLPLAHRHSFASALRVDAGDV